MGENIILKKIPFFSFTNQTSPSPPSSHYPGMESESPKTEKTEVFPFEPTSDLFFYSKSIIEEEKTTIFDDINDLKFLESPKTQEEHYFYFQATPPEKYSSHLQISNLTLLQMQNIKMDVDPVLSTASSIISGLESERQEEDEQEEEGDEEREEGRAEELEEKKEEGRIGGKKEKGKRKFRADKMEPCNFFHFVCFFLFFFHFNFHELMFGKN